MQCRDCGVQRSVTAGTAFGYTKLPLTRLLPAFEAARTFSSVSQIEEEHGVARSTAWHILHRTLKVIAHAFDSATEVDPWHWRQEIRLQATGTAPLPPSAPPDLQVAQARGGATWVPARFDVVGGLPQVGFIGNEERNRARELGEYATGARGLRKYLRHHLTIRRQVSLRWSARWIAGLVTEFLHPDMVCVPPLAVWLVRAQIVGHAPRRLLDPWRTRAPWMKPAEGLPA